MLFGSPPSAGDALLGPREGPKPTNGWTGRALRGIMILFAGCALVGSYIAAGLAYSAADHLRAHQLAGRSQVTATLLRPADSVRPDAAQPLHATAQAPARWTAPNGEISTGLVAVGVDASAGDEHAVWVDRSGDLSPPPISSTQIALSAIAVGVGINAVAAAMLYGTWRSARRLAARRRWRALDAEWAAVEPEWSRRL